MLNLLILLISCIIVFFLKTFDIKREFDEDDIDLTLLDSLKILFLVTVSLYQIYINDEFKSDIKYEKSKLNKILVFLRELSNI